MKEITEFSNELINAAISKGFKGNIVVNKVEMGTEDVQVLRKLKTPVKKCIEFSFALSDSFEVLTTTEEMDETLRRIAEEMKNPKFFKGDVRKKLGKLEGADYILFISIVPEDSERFQLIAELRDVVKGTKVGNQKVLYTSFYYKKAEEARETTKRMIIISIVSVSILFCVCVGIVISLNVRNKKREKSFPLLLETAKRLKEKKEYAKAYQYAKNALRLNPRDTDAVELKHEIERVSQGNPVEYDAALRSFERTKKLFLAGDIEGALQEIEKGESGKVVFPEMIELRNEIMSKWCSETLMKASKFLEKGNLTKALEYTNKILEKEPNEPDALCLKEEIKKKVLQEEKRGELLKDVEKAKSLFLGGNYEDAKAILRNVLLQDELKEAEKLLSEIDRATERIRGIYESAIGAIREGRPHRGKELLVQYNDQFPGNDEVAILLKRIKEAETIDRICLSTEGEKTYMKNGETITIGREEDNDIVVKDERISRHHLSITISGGGIIFKDLDSKNGIFVNGKALQKLRIMDDVSFNLGKVKDFRLKVGKAKDVRRKDTSLTQEMRRTLTGELLGSRIEYLFVSSKEGERFVLLRKSFPLGGRAFFSLYEGIFFIEVLKPPVLLNNKEVDSRAIVVFGDTLLVGSKKFNVKTL